MRCAAGSSSNVKEKHEPTPQAGFTFRPRRFYFVLAAIALTAAFLFSFALCRPASYRVRAVDFAMLPGDKQSLAELVQSVADRLNTGQDAEILLNEEQVNRWITARHELWPAEQLPELSGIKQPAVRFLGEGRIEIAATSAGRVFPVVVSIQTRVTLDPEGVMLTPAAAYIGRLPIPIAIIEQLLSGAREFRFRSNNSYGFLLERTGVWPNGRRGYEITHLTVETGRARIVLKPQAP